MPRCLNLAFAGALACFVVGCATQSKPTLTTGRRIPRVRTTVYTVTKEEAELTMQSAPTFPAAGIECRFRLVAIPAWTRFRLADTSEEYVIDDYGNALVGTDTIDLYKAIGRT